MIIWTERPNPFSCAYPLNMTQAQAIDLEYADLMSVTGQEASYTIQGGIEGYYDVITGTDQTSPQLIDTSTGKKTILFKFVAPSISTGDGESSAVMLSGSIYDSSSDGVLQVGVSVNSSSRNAVVFYDGSVAFSVFNIPETAYFSLCFDSTTSTLYIYNGATLAYSGTYIPKVGAQLDISAAENDTLSAPDTGKQYTLEVFTSASDIMSATEVPSYPSGATDICGNPL